MADAYALPYGDFVGRMEFLKAERDDDDQPPNLVIEGEKYRYTGLGV